MITKELLNLSLMANEGKDASSPHQRYEQFISSLPLRQGSLRSRWYRGCLYPEIHLPGLLAFCDDFKPLDTDIFLLSLPKSGTTWLKALVFATAHRKDHSPFAPDHPLLRLHPHDCVPMVDEVFGQGQESKLDALPSPRILNMHAAYPLLPQSLTSSECKFIYICRDPKDTMVSGWHFGNRVVQDGREPVPGQFDKAFESFCRGLSPFGPFWEHILGHWRESLKRPWKILFLKYEDMMEDPEGNLRKIAEFLECPFSKEEEKDGVAEGIVRLCSFQKLSGLEVNRTGDRGLKHLAIENSSYFRKGKVGDWKNYLTADMVEKLDRILEEKFRGSGLSFGHAQSNNAVKD